MTADINRPVTASFTSAAGSPPGWRCRPKVHARMTSRDRSQPRRPDAPGLIHVGALVPQDVHGELKLLVHGLRQRLPEVAGLLIGFALRSLNGPTPVPDQLQPPAAPQSLSPAVLRELIWALITSRFAGDTGIRRARQISLVAQINQMVGNGEEPTAAILADRLASNKSVIESLARDLHARGVLARVAGSGRNSLGRAYRLSIAPDAVRALAAAHLRETGRHLRIMALPANQVVTADELVVQLFTLINASRFPGDTSARRARLGALILIIHAMNVANEPPYLTRIADLLDAGRANVSVYIRTLTRRGIVTTTPIPTLGLGRRPPLRLSIADSAVERLQKAHQAATGHPIRPTAAVARHRLQRAHQAGDPESAPRADAIGR